MELRHLPVVSTSTYVQEHQVAHSRHSRRAEGSYNLLGWRERSVTVGINFVQELTADLRSRGGRSPSSSDELLWRSRGGLLLYTKGVLSILPIEWVPIDGYSLSFPAVVQYNLRTY